jgi:pimeloyl-ACP methyl ester carboxylesterase
VARLVLVDAAGIPAVAHLPDYVAPMVRASSALVPRFLPVLAADAMRAGPWNLLRAALDLQQQDVRPVLGDIEAPTLIVWGRRDMLVPLSAGRTLQEGIRCSQLAVIPGAGHVPMYDCPELFVEATLPFLLEGE